MKRMTGMTAAVLGICICAVLAGAQDTAKPGLLSAPELRKVVPSVYFFRGQSATVQIRNAGGFRTKDGKYVLAALVDTSGYSTDVAEKYQGLLITEVKLDVGGKELAPGAYGFGFGASGKFLVLDVGANDLFTVSSAVDEQLRRPVPLMMEEHDGGYRLYAGRKWVEIKEK